MLFYKYYILIVFAVTVTVAQNINNTGVDLTLKSNLGALSQLIATEQHRVTLKGVAKLDAKSDHAFFSLKIKIRSGTFQSAIDKLDKKVSDLRYWIIKAGIPDQNFLIGEFVTTPGRGGFLLNNVYRVNNVIKIKLRSRDDLAKVAANIKKDKEIEVLGITFEFSNQDSLMNILRERALDAALKKAGLYEKKLKLVLVPIHFKEFESIKDQFGTDLRQTRPLKKYISARKDESAGEYLQNINLSEIGFGAIKLETTIVVTFEIMKK